MKLSSPVVYPSRHKCQEYPDLRIIFRAAQTTVGRSRIIEIAYSIKILKETNVLTA